MAVAALTLTLALAAAFPHENVNVARAVPALTVGMEWDYPLGYTMTASKANNSVPFYSVDMFDTAASDIAALQKAGHFVACYISVGTWENWRSDAKSFPSGTYKNNVDGWAGEKWLDTRNSTVRQLMANRITMAQQKGCNGIDPDNTDGYDNDTGFPLTQADGVNYIQYICSQAHSKGMKCGLKNSGDIVPQVVSVTEWAIVEQCVEYNECSLYQPYINAGKPVFDVEYDDDDSSPDSGTIANDCSPANFGSIIKHTALDQWTYFCK